MLPDKLQRIKVRSDLRLMKQYLDSIYDDQRSAAKAKNAC